MFEYSVLVASKWLQVVPSSQLGLLLDNNSARIAAGLRLGSNLCEEYVCVCGALVKRDGLHGLSLSCKMRKKKIYMMKLTKYFVMHFLQQHFGICCSRLIFLGMMERDLMA